VDGSVGSPGIRVFATVATPLTPVVYNNGAAGVGATITDNSGTFAPFVADGTATSVGQSFTIREQTPLFQNGVYVLTTQGDGVAISYVLTRSTSFDTPAKVTAGVQITSTSGVSRASEINVVLSPAAAAIGVDSIDFLSMFDLAIANSVPASSIQGNSTAFAAPVASLGLGAGLLFSGATLAASVTPAGIQQGSFITAVDSGAADAYVLALTPASAALTDGMILRFIASGTSTINNPTVNVDGHGALLISDNGQVLATADIVINKPVDIQYVASTTVWNLLNPARLTSYNLVTNRYTIVMDTSGSASAYLGTNGVLPTSTLVAGTAIDFSAQVTNAGASTLNYCASGALPIVLLSGAALSGSELPVGRPVRLVVNDAGTAWVLQTPNLSTVTPVQVQRDVFNSGTDVGVMNAYVIALSPPVTVLTPFLQVVFMPAIANSGASTLNVGTGVKALGFQGQPLQANDLSASVQAYATYNSVLDQFQLLNPQVSGDFYPVSIQNAEYTSAIENGLVNAYNVDLAPPLGTIVNNTVYTFTPTNANTLAAVTIVLNGLPAVPIVLKAGALLAVADLQVNVPAMIMYSAAANTFELLNPQVSGGGVGGSSYAKSILLMGG